MASVQKVGKALLCTEFLFFLGGKASFNITSLIFISLTKSQVATMSATNKMLNVLYPKVSLIGSAWILPNVRCSSRQLYSLIIIHYCETLQAKVTHRCTIVTYNQSS